MINLEPTKKLYLYAYKHYSGRWVNTTRYCEGDAEFVETHPDVIFFIRLDHTLIEVAR